MNSNHRGRCVVRAVLGFSLVFAVVCTCASARVKKADLAARQRALLDADWRFHRGDVSADDAAQSVGYDDHSWQRVQLPHDYVLDGNYNPTNTRNHGYLPFEPAWYRKHFFISSSDQGKILQLEFGGIFRDSEVWLNGQLLGRHASGYTGFTYDITKTAHCGGENVIAVRVDPRQFEGWWYEGGGIYRHVYFDAMSPLHVAPSGTYVVSKVQGGNEGARDEADLTIETTIQNDNPMPVNCGVVSDVLGPDGASVKTVENMQLIPANSTARVVQHAVLRHPRLWDLDSPQLYQLRTILRQNGNAADSTITTLGIRTIRFDPDNGFFLNGRRIEIRGVANHQDFPAVGIAVPDSLQSWRVSQLKKMGCNAWRTAHNPPNESVLDACDRLGMLVMDENRHLGDSYASHSPPGTTHTNLADLASMIQRDRNHPSIIMWSMCNEEGLQGTPEGANIFLTMAEVVHRYDQSRPITCAMNAGWLTSGIADVEDLIGVNYNVNRYDAIHADHPRQPMFGSETANQKTARDVYSDDRTNGLLSAYHLSDESWGPVAERSFMAGLFVWTGFDYRGEPNPDGWPDISNNTGLMDVCGFPKDKYYYFESWWSDKPMVHLLPVCWNWPGKEGQPIRVIAFSNARQVELFLNGKSLGAKPMLPNGHLEWEVPYAPGRLLAKASTDGHVVAADHVETVGPPAGIQLAADRRELSANGEDTIVVPVSILDAKGRLVANASNRVLFQLEGNGRLLGVGNGNPGDHDPDRASQHNAFNGHCLAVIQASSQPGVLRLTAASPGLKPATLTLLAR